MSSKTRAEKTQPSEPPCLLRSLPEDVIFDILARVPRCEYTTLSVVSKHFRSLVRSPELYAARRSFWGCTEHSLYVVLSDRETRGDHRLYILHQKANGNRRLLLIRSLPPMPRDGSFVLVGSKIYVFERNKRTASSIDCRSHTVQPLPCMPISMVGIVAAGTIKGKIYVIGYYIYCKKVMLVFDTDTQKWESEVINAVGDLRWSHFVVVMGDKIYMRDYQNSFVYELEGNKWGTEKMLNFNEWKNACVVDDVLYYYDSGMNKLRAYDPKQRCWGVVKGLEPILLTDSIPSWLQTDTVNYGGRLALFTYIEEDIWCAEISLIKREGGEIWGKIEWFDHVMTGGFVVRKSLAHML